MKARQRAVLGSALSLVLLMSPWLTSAAWADPIADHGGPYSGTVNVKVDFDASGSVPGDYPINAYLWDFGDGNTGTRKKQSHTYSATGTFVVILTVTDTTGASSTATTTATIVDPTTSTTTSSTTTTTTTTTTTPTTTSTTTTTTPSTTSTTTTTTPSTTSTTTTITASTTSTTGATGSTTSTTGATGSSTTAPPEPVDEIAAAEFSVFPTSVEVENEIALTVALYAQVPDTAEVRFLLDGVALGDAVTVDVHASPSEADHAAVFTRRLPTDLAAGPHRVELVTNSDPPQVLGSVTFDVVGPASEALPPDAEPEESGAPGSGNSSPVFVLAGGIGVAVVVAGLAARRRLTR